MRRDERELLKLFVRPLERKRGPRHLVFRFSPLRYIAENEDATDEISGLITDGRGAVVNEKLPAVPGEELCVVGKANGPSLGNSLFQRVCHYIPRRLIDDSEYLSNVAAHGFTLAPAGEVF